MSTDTTAAAERACPRATPTCRRSATAPRWPTEIELAWQDRWAAEGTFHTPNPSGPWADPEPRAAAGKVYLLDMFPYPSGTGLHVGHPLGFIGTDVLGRYLRMTGHNVLHAMGFDAFGLPAEQYAVQTGTHPRTTTERNVERYRAQLRRLGLAHDDRRSVATTDVDVLPLDPVDLPADLQLLVRRGSSSGPGRSPSWRPSWPPAPAPTRTAAPGPS